MTVKQFLIATGGVLGTVALQLAAPELTQDQKALFWLLVAIFWIAFALYEVRCRWRRARMGLLPMILVGAVLGGIAAAAVVKVFPIPKPPEADNPTALVIRKGTTVSVGMCVAPDPTAKPASPDDLELYVFALMSCAGEDNIQYADVTITNRSPRKMHLEIIGYWDYWKNNGEPARSGTKAEWSPKGLDQHTGETFIDLDAWETKKGRIVLFLGKPTKEEKEEVGARFIDATERVHLEVVDSVSGKRAAFNPSTGYPSGQVSSPITSHKTLLALEFPKLGDNAAAPPHLDLIVRTRDLGYNKTNAGVDALIRNTSSAPMDLEVGLLVRSMVDPTTWAEVEGKLKKAADKDSELGGPLTVEPGETVECKMSFNLAPVGYEEKKCGSPGLSDSGGGNHAAIAGAYSASN